MSNLLSYLRFLSKNKIYTAITIVGFSISLCFVILLASFVRKELAVDSFQTNKENIYLMAHNEYPHTSSPIGPLLKENFAEIENYCRIIDQIASITTEDNRRFSTSVYWADKGFFQMFSFPLVRGDKETVFTLQNSVVIAESYSKDLFRDEDPIDKTVTIDGLEFIVTGIMKDLPENSIFYQRKLICNYESMRDLWGDSFMDEYNSNSAFLFIQTTPNSNIKAKAPEVLTLLKEVSWMYKQGLIKETQFESLKEVYFSSLKIDGFILKGQNKSFIVIMMAIAVLILILAIINYINLSISQSVLRDKEIAVRKLMGSSRGNMFGKILGESIFICGISSTIALLLAFVMEPVFSSVLGTSVNFASLFSATVAITILLFSVILGVLSGLLPAYSLTKISPIGLIRGELAKQNKKYYTKVLISVQYTASICLLICGGVVAQQTSYLRNFDIGFNKENLLSIENNDMDAKKASLFKEKVLAIPGVQNFASVCGSPLDGGNNNSGEVNGKNVSFQVFLVDSTYFDFMELEVTKTGAAYDKDAIFLNQSGVREIGTDQTPTSMKFGSKDVSIYGIVRNFNYRKLNEQVGPAFLKIRPKDKYPWSMLVKLEPTANKAVIAEIEKAYKQITDGAPMDVKYADSEIHSWYEQQERTAKMISLFALLTLLISIMGNYAMSLYYTKQRTKEVGVRRVNGATEIEIITMLNKGFLLWVLVGFVLACPISYYAMQTWLQGFAYHTSISWGIFILAGSFMAFIALLSMSMQTIRTARANPVDSLKNE